MFGMLRTASCGLSIAEKRQWHGYVCGVCLALRNEYGHPARLATNTDAALLALLHDSLVEPHPHTIEHRCLLRRGYKGIVPDPDGLGLRYASCLALLMAATKVLDRVADGEIRSRPARKLASGLANRWLAAADAQAADLDFDTSSIVEQVQRQVALEAGPQTDFLTYAQPTEVAVGCAFRHVGIMTSQEETASALFDMGRFYGRIMYLLDSVQDYENDISADRFNPLTSIWATNTGPQQIQEYFRTAIHGLRTRLTSLNIKQPALANSMLVRQISCNGNRILRTCLVGGASIACQIPGGFLLYEDPEYREGMLGRRKDRPEDERSIDDQSEQAAAWGGDCCFDSTCCNGSDCDGNGCCCCSDGDGCCECNCCDGDGCDCNCCDGGCCEGCDGCDCSCD